jgi:hypothetical protein
MPHSKCAQKTTQLARVEGDSKRQTPRMAIPQKLHITGENSLFVRKSGFWKGRMVAANNLTQCPISSFQTHSCPLCHTVSAFQRTSHTLKIAYLSLTPTTGIQ